MKIVKTQSRWKLHEYGYPVAIRFDNYDDFRKSKVEDWCKDRFGSEGWMWNPNDRSKHWVTHWGSPSSTGRPYFVGFRDAGVITTLVLTLGLTVEKTADIFG